MKFTWTITVPEEPEEWECPGIQNGKVYGYQIDYGDGFVGEYSLEDPDSLFEYLPGDVWKFFQRLQDKLLTQNTGSG